MASPQQPPFAQDLSIKSKDYNHPVPLASDYNYAEKITGQTVNGIKPPLWIIVFGENASKNSTAKNESKPYKIQNGQLQVISNKSTEPANDIYFILKPGQQQSVLHYVGRRAGFNDAILFKGKPLISNVHNVTPPKSFTLPGIGGSQISKAGLAAVGVLGAAAVAVAVARGGL